MIIAFELINFESMKYLFIVQGEGRGHMTQAMTLERMLLDRGHEVVGIMVGKSPIRKVPEFFLKGVKAPVSFYESVNFQPSAENRKPSMVKTMLFNTLAFHKYRGSICSGRLPNQKNTPSNNGIGRRRSCRSCRLPLY